MLTLRKSAASIAFRVVLPILGLGAAACTAARPAPPAAPLKPLRAATLDEVLAAYDSYCESGTTLSASGNLDVRDRKTGKGRTLGVRVMHALGARIYFASNAAGGAGPAAGTTGDGTAGATTFYNFGEHCKTTFDPKGAKWADHYAGKFDDGWDAYRAKVFERQKELAEGVPERHTLNRPQRGG